MVLFPDPDSPTIARERPGLMLNDALATATVLPKTFRSSVTSTVGVPLISAPI